MDFLRAAQKVGERGNRHIRSQWVGMFHRGRFLADRVIRLEDPTGWEDLRRDITELPELPLPPELAELLDVPSLTFARKVEKDGDKIRIERQTESGYNVVEAPLPVLLTVTSGVVEPRYPNFKGIMQAKKKPVDTKTCADLGIEPAVQQVIQSVEVIPARQAGEIIEDEGEGYLKIIEKLEEAKVI